MLPRRFLHGVFATNFCEWPHILAYLDRRGLRERRIAILLNCWHHLDSTYWLRLRVTQQR